MQNCLSLTNHIPLTQISMKVNGSVPNNPKYNKLSSFVKACIMLAFQEIPNETEIETHIKYLTIQRRIINIYRFRGRCL